MISMLAKFVSRVIEFAFRMSQMMVDEEEGQGDSFSYSPLLAVSRLTRLPLLSVSPWNFSSRLDALYVVT